MRKTIALILTVLIIFALSTEAFAEAKGAVLIDAESGRVLFSRNKDERLPMASTTKIMTALIALEQTDADERFTVSGSAIAAEGSSMGLLPGAFWRRECFSLRGTTRQMPLQCVWQAPYPLLCAL